MATKRRSVAEKEPAPSKRPRNLSRNEETEINDLNPPAGSPSKEKSIEDLEEDEEPLEVSSSFICVLRTNSFYVNPDSF